MSVVPTAGSDQSPAQVVWQHWETLQDQSGQVLVWQGGIGDVDAKKRGARNYGSDLESKGA